MGNGLKWIFNEYEFDNRVNNLAWTVSGKYDEEIDSSEKDYSSKDANVILKYTKKISCNYLNILMFFNKWIDILLWIDLFEKYLEKLMK